MTLSPRYSIDNSPIIMWLLTCPTPEFTRLWLTLEEPERRGIAASAAITVAGQQPVSPLDIDDEADANCANADHIRAALYEEPGGNPAIRDLKRFLQFYRLSRLR